MKTKTDNETEITEAELEFEELLFEVFEVREVRDVLSLEVFEVRVDFEFVFGFPRSSTPCEVAHTELDKFKHPPVEVKDKVLIPVQSSDSK